VPNYSPVITIRHATKIAGATLAATTCPLVLNEIRSVAAFTPDLHGVVQSGGLHLRSSTQIRGRLPLLLPLPLVWSFLLPMACGLGFDSGRKNAIPAIPVGRRLNIFNNIARMPESPPISDPHPKGDLKPT